MKNKLGSHKFAERNLVIILAVFFVFLSIVSPTFLRINNLYNLVRQTAIIGVVSIGMTFVIFTGGIDLSVGSVLGFASITSSMMMVKGMPIFPAILFTMIFCAVLGLVNGIIIQDGQVPPFIATLGMLTGARGAVMLLSDARMIAGLPRNFTQFAQITILGLPSLFFVWLLIIIISVIITKMTVFGRNIYAFGSNSEAARLSGISSRAITYSVYTISALLSGIAGILMTSRLSNGIPTAGTGYELNAIAAVVVGGASMTGGSGTILGTILGAMIIAILGNGGNLLGVNPFVLNIITGVLIVASVMIDQKKKAPKK